MSRFVLPACVALTLLFVPIAPGAGSGVAVGVPSSVHAFLLRVDEPVANQYPRTPSFAWAPVNERGGHYQFELATSRAFEDSTIVFKDYKVPIPAVTVARQLPWMTGNPYALWAHVRWVSANSSRATLWSEPFGFNMRWDDSNVPQQLPAPEGLVRWKPVEGATGYEVLYLDIKPTKSFQTTTNVADEREYFTFHSDLGYSLTVHWRVRAIRDVSKQGQSTNGLPAVSYGPWSPVFTSTNAAQTAGTLTPNDTVSNAWATGKTAHPFQLTPAFAWSPADPVISDGIDPGSSLYRVYISTDNHCVNRVFTGSVVGSPAFAPRTQGGPIKLPGTMKALAKAKGGVYPGSGGEGTALDAVGDNVAANEAVSGSGAGASSSSGAAPSSPSGSSAPASSSSGSGASSSTGSGSGSGRAVVDLWDSGWPSGRYYWTVVPVTVFQVPNDDPNATDIPIGYQDAAVPQDACEAGQQMSFGKVTRPVVTAAGRPFVSGVAPGSRLMAAATGARPVVYSSPIVAWQPAVGATKYQLELSRSLYPWRAVNRLGTPATSIMLPLSKYAAGAWYYRVRGVNEALPVGAQKMAWSSPVPIQITGDRFAVVK